MTTAKVVYKPGKKKTYFQGEELRKQIGAAAYIECSSKTQQVCDQDLEPLQNK